MFDLHTLQMLVEVRAGINTRNMAVSGDGRYAIVANYLPHTLVILDATDLTIERVIPVMDDGGTSSRVSAVYDAAPRKSFIVALKPAAAGFFGTFILLQGMYVVAPLASRGEELPPG